MKETPTLDKGANAQLPSLTAEELEAKFDAGEDVSEYVDWESGVWVKPDEPTPGQIRSMGELVVSISLPAWARDRLNAEADRQGISQEDLAKQLIVRQLEQEKALA